MISLKKKPIFSIKQVKQHRVATKKKKYLLYVNKSGHTFIDTWHILNGAWILALTLRAATCFTAGDEVNQEALPNNNYLNGQHATGRHLLDTSLRHT